MVMAVIGAALSVDTAHARNEDGSWEMGAYIMNSGFDNDSNFDDAFGGGIRGAYHFKAAHALEVDYDVSEAEDSFNSARNIDITKLGIGYMHNFFVRGHEKAVHPDLHSDRRRRQVLVLRSQRIPLRLEDLPLARRRHRRRELGVLLAGHHGGGVVSVWRRPVGTQVPVTRASAEIRSPGKVAVVNVTARVRDALRQAPVRQGLSVVSVSHTTCGLCVNEDEEGLKKDIVRVASLLLEPLERQEPFRHDRIDNNARATASCIWGPGRTSSCWRWMGPAPGGSRCSSWVNERLLE
jgi:thiamine phosphate synthase YjbQ (UPF0047 family)